MPCRVYTVVMKRKWDVYSDETRKKCLDEIIARVDEIGDDGAGVIAAQDIVDIVVENIAPSLYAAGVKDARNAIQAKHDDLQVDLELLETENEQK